MLYSLVSLQSDDWDKPTIIGYGKTRSATVKGADLNGQYPHPFLLSEIILIPPLINETHVSCRTKADSI